MKSRHFSAFFDGFHRFLTSPKTDAHPMKNRLVKPNPHMGRLRVGKLATLFVMGRLRARHKPNLPNPWTTLTSSSILQSINYTHNVLFPRRKNPELMTHFHSINLSNVIYKAVSKVLTNKLWQILKSFNFD